MHPQLLDAGAPAEIAEINQKVAAANERAQLKWQAFDAGRKAAQKTLEDGTVPDDVELKNIDAIQVDYQAAADELKRLQRKRDELLTAHFDTGGGTTGLRTKAATKNAGRFLAEAKSLMTTTGLGAAVTPVEYAPFFFDLLAAQSVLLRSGVTQLNISGHSIKMPRLLTDVAASWVLEGDPIPESDATGDQITATPQKIGQIVAITREAWADTNPAALAIAEMSLSRAIALGIDKGFFEGTGTAPQIRGLKNISGTGTISMGTNGGTLTNLDPIANAIASLAAVNANATAIAMHPNTWGKLVVLKSTTNEYLLEDEPNGPAGAAALRLFGVPVYLSTQISTTETQGSASNATSIWVYDAEKLVAVQRQGTQVDAYPYYKFQNDMWGVRVTARWDLAVPFPAAVTRIVGIL